MALLPDLPTGGVAVGSLCPQPYGEPGLRYGGLGGAATLRLVATGWVGSYGCSAHDPQQLHHPNPELVMASFHGDAADPGAL